MKCTIYDVSVFLYIIKSDQEKRGVKDSDLKQVDMTAFFRENYKCMLIQNAWW